MAAERQIVVETAQVTKIFRDFWMRKKVKALDCVDLKVNKGEIFGLLGPNGSGKSTLVKLLLGLLFPTTGRVAVFGRDPRNIAIKDRIGYMPEESYLYRYLNAEETLNFYGRLFNLPSRERKHRVKLLLDMVGLERQRKRPIIEYSKGMARRIGLAQALINDPDLVFLDEPTTGLDPVGTREIKDLIGELKNRGKTVFLCSHLLADVEDLCDRIAILYGGRVRRVGRLDELLRDRELTQITSTVLQPETVQKLIDLIAELEGDASSVEVEAPRDRLEKFFLKVVEEARAARIETAGTVVGTGAATYFEGIKREDKAEAILSSLLEAAKPLESGTPRGEDTPVVVPAPASKSKVDVDMLKELVKESKPKEVSKTSSEQPEERRVPLEEEAPIVVPASRRDPNEKSTEDILGELLQKDDPSKTTSADEDGYDKAER